VRPCGWCRLELEATRRPDALWCSKRCRQAACRARFRRARIRATDRPLRLAYADPPYPGKAYLYVGHPDYRGEVDHAELIRRLSRYDGWALSTSAAALPAILALCVAQDLPVRIAAWVKGRPRPHATARIRQAWEPVVWIPARHLSRVDGRQTEDALVGVASRRRTPLPGHVIGMKPPAFCYWVFDLLGAQVGDELDDLYPGSGIVRWAWASYLAGDATRSPRDVSSPPSGATPAGATSVPGRRDASFEATNDTATA